VPSEPITVDGDSVRLTQVLENLLHNALKFTDPGGTVGVALSRLADTATLAVRDNGVGIPKDSIGEVFELFRQLAGAASHSRAGLGIGLHLVKQIAELHGGRARARSGGEGLGSEFLVELPVAEPTAADVLLTASPAKTVEPPPGRCKVLVVDDLPEVAASLATLLEVIGHEVRVAHDGPSAIEAVMSERPDLIILDIAMPQMNGYEIARTLRSCQENKDLVLVALTGRDQPQDRLLSLEAGIDHHLTKPATLAQLNSVLRRRGHGPAVADAEKRTGVNA
jgi:CheY-like chemotaxis protein